MVVDPDLQNQSECAIISLYIVRKPFSILFAMCAFAVAGADDDGLAISISRIHEFSGVTNRVVLHGRVGPFIKQQCVLSDETGSILLTTRTSKRCQSGDYIRVAATTYPNKDDLHVLARSIQIL